MLLSMCLWGALRANAQEAPGVAVPAPAPEPANPVVSIAEAAAWFEERGTSGFDSQLASLARSADGSSWLLGLEDGTIYRSMDGARTWARVLRSPGERAEEPDEEALLLEGEEVVREEGERADSESDTTDDAETSASEESVVTDATAASSSVDRTAAPGDDVARVEVDVDRATTDTLLDDHGAEARSATVWFDPEDPQVALAGRSDGIWRSDDGGLHWAKVDSAADAWRFLSVPAMGVVVAGSSNGVRVSPDGGQRWFDAVDVTDGLAVRALTTLGTKIVAGTAAGLFESKDGLRWKKLPFSGAVTGVLPDPSWPGGLWVSTAEGLFRTDDGGATFYTAGRQVMRGLRGLAALRGQGHLTTWGADGVWESMDGGVTWHPVFAGLRDPDVRDLVVVGDQPLIIGSRSVWRLMAGPRGAGGLSGGGLAEGLSDRLQNPIALDEQQLLGLMVDVATRRVGLDLEALRPEALGMKAFLPTVGVQTTYGWLGGRDSSPYTAQTTEYGDVEFEVRATLCFGGCLSNTVLDIADFADTSAPELSNLVGELSDSVSALDDLGDFYAINGEIITEGGEPFAATNVAQGIRKYRGQVSDQVVGAWSSLQRTTHSARPASLAGAVTRLLDIQEAEARLDLYTDGAYSRARIAETTK